MESQIRPFRIETPDDQLLDLTSRLEKTRWPEKETVDDWTQGVPLIYIMDICDYWANSYDWRRCEKRINSFPQFKTTIDGLDIHFLHIKSRHADAFPLLITHGWPGSIVEFLKIIEPLTDPIAHGGQADDAFDIVCPSLPGYGYSAKPEQTGWNVGRIASTWAQLMARLGYERYGAQGGDWGSGVTSIIGLQDSSHVAGIHLNMPVVSARSMTTTDITLDEQMALSSLIQRRKWDSGYSKVQATRPQTVGYGLVDSPAALCAWIIEKFWAWTDCAGHPENALSRDEMLDNVMLYWLTASGASSARLYWEGYYHANTDPIGVATGCSIFPKEILRISRRWASSRFTNIVYWNELDRGGHFAAFEQPELFVGEMRNFFALVR